LISILIFSCRDSDAPDITNIKVELPAYRFENDFFSMDTNNVQAGIGLLQQRYGNFVMDFLVNIMGLPPVTDTSGHAEKAIRQFIHDYAPIYNETKVTFQDFESLRNKTEQGLRYVKYYFPSYTLPPRMITFIGPMDAYFEGSLGGYGDAITADGLAVGLQLHMGSNNPLYKSQVAQSLYPVYISRKFSPDHIPVNCLKNVVDDLFPDNSTSRPLIEQMVEKGKRLYLLNKFLPRTPDTLKIGYTKSQLEGCYQNEGLIWNFFLTNSLLFNSEPAIIKSYIGDAPNTPEFGSGAPGYIGLFTGWQIVKKYMEMNEQITLQQLMETDARKIFEESKYRPK
jgi:hypothetical protein